LLEKTPELLAYHHTHPATVPFSAPTSHHTTATLPEFSSSVVSQRLMYIGTCGHKGSAAFIGGPDGRPHVAFF